MLFLQIFDKWITPEELNANTDDDEDTAMTPDLAVAGSSGGDA
jgi:hypothetical protein